MPTPFKAKLEIIIGNPFVFVPEPILQTIFKAAKKTTSPIPVKGKINGQPFTQTLVRYAGAWRLYVNGIMFKAIGMEMHPSIGKTVKLELAYNPKPPTFPMPAEFKKALASSKTATATFKALAPYRQKEILRYLGFMKSKVTLMKNIDRIMDYLHGGKPKVLRPLLHIKAKTKPAL